MDICPKCGKILSEDEKILYKCISCGTKFTSSLPKDNKQLNYRSPDNTVAKVIKICGIIIIILGTISSFVLAGRAGKNSLLQFLTSEAISIITGLVFIGFSEVIQLLEDIKNKLK